MGFNYQPLDHSSREIRLIRLLPGHNGDPLECQLMQSTLDTALSYESLSYVWGDSTLAQPLILNGNHVSITENLEVALLGLRLSDAERILWVDALCINQSDIAERNHQVSHMRDIYEQAARVVVWLGESSENSSDALAFVKELAAFANTHDVSEEFMQRGREALFNMNRLSDWEALDALMNRPWWKRVWVVQEVVVSSNVIVMCGSDSIDWSIFTPALSVPRGFSEERRHFWKNAGRTMAQIMQYTLIAGFPQRDSGDTTLRELLERAWMREATDPRDKVFALLGLAVDNRVDSPKPDYSKAVEQVYKECAKEVIARESNLMILEHTGRVRQNSNLPSWVPDWRSDTYSGRPRDITSLSWLVRTFDLGPSNPGLKDSVQYGHDVNAAGDVSFRAVFDPDLAHLEVLGMHVDIIQELGKILNEENFLEAVGESITLGSKLPELYSTGEIRSVAINQVRHGGFWFPCETDSPDESRLFSISFSSWEHRRFMISRKGFMGLVPGEAVVGDLICIFAGSAVPYILRSEGPHYKLIGQAYVHGIMHSEMVCNDGSHADTWHGISLK